MLHDPTHIQQALIQCYDGSRGKQNLLRTKEMEAFIHYLPPSQDTGSLPESIEGPVSGLMDEFRRFLRSEQQYLQNRGTH